MLFLVSSMSQNLVDSQVLLQALKNCSKSMVALHGRHLALVSSRRARIITPLRAIFCPRSHLYSTLRCLSPQGVVSCARVGLCWQRCGC
jgi:hypothetical protein